MKWSLGGFCLQGPGKQLVFYLDQRTLQNILRSPSECWKLISTSSPGLFSPNGRHFNGPMRRWWLPVTIQKMKKEDKGYLFLTVILLKPWKSVQGQRGLCFFSTKKNNRASTGPEYVSIIPATIQAVLLFSMASHSGFVGKWPVFI